MASTEGSWRHLVFVTKTSVSSNFFIDNLVCLSRIKQELAMTHFVFNF